MQMRGLYSFLPDATLTPQTAAQTLTPTQTPPTVLDLTLATVTLRSAFYYYPPRRLSPQQDQLPVRPYWMSEWYQGWEGIDETGPPDPQMP
ncbi:unnamed protein product [Discosporangium mesarthrocarpum]